MRIAIVDDLPMAVEALRRIIAAEPGLEVAWTARDGVQAVAKCAADRPDLILMDLIMPEMDGVEASRRIMSETPCPILVVTATVEGNASRVFDAMGHGALDAVNKPNLSQPEGGRELLKKISRMAGLTDVQTVARPRAVVATQPDELERPPLFAIGCSAGGPAALSRVLSGLPADLDAAVLIVQHVDSDFAPGLASWLTSQVPLEVEIARSGQRPRAGLALLACSTDHLVLSATGSLAYSAEPRETPYRPSVDALFHSLSRYWTRPGIAAVLTGMGKDGAQGLLALRQSGWHTLAQDQETSLIYGMPRACRDAGAAVEILPIEAIAPEVLRFLSRREKQGAGS